MKPSNDDDDGAKRRHREESSFELEASCQTEQANTTIESSAATQSQQLAYDRIELTPWSIKFDQSWAIYSKFHDIEAHLLLGGARAVFSLKANIKEDKLEAYTALMARNSSQCPGVVDLEVPILKYHKVDLDTIKLTFDEICLDNQEYNFSTATLCIIPTQQSCLDQIIELLSSAYKQDVYSESTFISAYSSEFIDPANGVELVKKYLDETMEAWLQHESRLAPFCTVCQSSGFGKTRTIKELAKERESAFICLRDLEEEEGVSDRSPLAKEFLDSLQNENAALRFLYSLVLNCIKVINETESDKDTSAERLFKYQPWHYYRRNTNNDDLIKYEQFKKRVIGTIRSLYGDPMGDSFQKEQEWIDYFRQGKSLTIFVDEAAKLLGPSAQKSRSYSTDHDNQSTEYESLFLVLRRSAQYLFRKTRVLIVLTDTNMALAKYEPEPRVVSSSSRRLDLVQLNKPFFALCYIDQHATDYLAQFTPQNLPDFQRDQFNQCNRFSTIFRLGRPLWASLLSTDYSEVIQFAVKKLLCENEWSSIQSKNKMAAALAVLSTRTTITPTIHPSITNQLIAKHMATLYAVNHLRNQYMIRYISEPILAEAAASVMSTSETFLDVMNNFNNLLQHGSLGPLGAIGEFVSQIILLKAFDKLNSDDGLVTRAYTVEQFLRSLVGDNFDKYMVHHMDKTLLKATLCFTHFIKKTDQDVTYQQMMRDFVARCAAGQFKEYNEDFDLFLVALSEDGIVPILIQIKNSTRPFKSANQLVDGIDQAWFRDRVPGRRDFLILCFNMDQDTFKERKCIEVSVLNEETRVDSASTESSVRPLIEQKCAFTFNGFTGQLFQCFTEKEISVLRLILDNERFEINSLDWTSPFVEQVMAPCR